MVKSSMKGESEGMGQLMWCCGLHLRVWTVFSPLHSVFCV